MDERPDAPKPARAAAVERSALEGAPSEGSSFDGVVVAAGSSTRMAGRDKLDALLGGVPVLRRSVEMLATAGAARIVIVTAPGRVAALAAEPWLPAAVVSVVAGGARRQESVAAGVAALGRSDAPADTAGDGDAGSTSSGAAMAQGAGQVASGGATAAPGAAAAAHVILIHDAARPLATPALARRVAAAAAVHGAAIPVLPVADTLKRLDGEWVGETVDRRGLAAAQTPQGFRHGLLERAYAAFPPDGEQEWTDEAALLEACRIAVHAIDGEAMNLKLTLPSDLERAEAALASGAVLASEAALGSGAVHWSPPALGQDAALGARASGAVAGLRVGFGSDTHPFGPGEPLMLGGLRFDGVPRLHGHSDGDVVLHALADALLGAAGLGDLGALFPADARTPRGIDSRELVAEVVRRVTAAGWDAVSVDLTIVAARPRLGPRLAEMAAAVAALVGLPSGGANVKASTGNLAGSDGAGGSISAHAVAVLAPAARRVGAGEANE